MTDKPTGGDDAATNDGRVVAWGLADVAFELRTANLIALMDWATRNGLAQAEDHYHQVTDRLGLTGEEK